MAKCNSCGAPIVWVQMKGGRPMPCNARLIPYKANSEGKQFIVNDQGETVRCDLTFEEPATGMGRISHFATCPNASRHRKKR